MTPLTLNDEFSAIYDEVNDMFHGAAIDGPRLRGIHVRIIHLLGRGLKPSVAYATLSTIDLLLGNQKQALSHAETSMRASDEVSPPDSQSFVQATTTLYAAALFDDLFDKIDAWLAKRPGDIRALKSAIVQSFSVAQFTKQLHYESMLTQIPSVIATEIQMKLSKVTEQTKNLASQCGLYEGDVLSRLGVAISTLRSSDFEPKKIMRQLISDGSFVIQLYVDAERERTAELTFDIFDALADNFEMSTMELFSISCLPFKDWSGPGIRKDEV